ncbi:MAG: hypothetical protein ACFFCS_15755 [Candidatus Hodarchaeota archaeon]
MPSTSTIWSRVRAPDCSNPINCLSNGVNGFFPSCSLMPGKFDVDSSVVHSPPLLGRVVLSVVSHRFSRARHVYSTKNAYINHGGPRNF